MRVRPSPLLVLVVLAVLLACSSCQTEAPNAKPEQPSGLSVPSGQTSSAPATAPVKPRAEAAPAVIAPAIAAPSASAAAEAPDEGHCVTAAESQEIAKPHQNAAPPYAACAAGIFAHCGGGDGERGHLCSRPLDPKLTATTRKTKPDSCCYRMQ